MSGIEYKTLKDPDLITACLKGEAQAWEALIHRYQRLIYSIPIKTGFSPVDAADVFQAVCMKLFQRLDSLRDLEKVSSWLITTTTRECWRVASERKRESQPSIYDDDYATDILDRLASNEPLADEQRIALERQHAVRQALEIISDRCRRLLTMLFYEKDDLSYTDIARRMKVPINSIGPTRARCLQKLKKLLDGKL